MYHEKKMHAGNLFFKHKYASIDIMETLKNTNSFEEFEKFYTDELIDGNVLLGTYLTALMERYKTTSKELEEPTGYHYSYFQKVKKGQKNNPGRDFLLAICVYMRVTVEEAQVLLQYAGEPPLYARNRRDALIWYALWKKQGLVALNTYLADRGFPLLRKPSKKEDEDE